VMGHQETLVLVRGDQEVIDGIARGERSVDFVLGVESFVRRG